MLRLLLKKLVQGVAMVLIVTAITFSLLASAGGDALSGLRDDPQVSEETIERLRASYGLDKPLIQRYITWLGNSISGDMGVSFAFKTPVVSIVAARLKNTLLMGLIGFIFAAVLALAVSFCAERFRSRTLSAAVDIFVLVTASAPRMVLAFAALVFAISYSFSAGSSGDPSTFQLVAGAIVLGLPLASVFTAQLRDALSSVMGEDYIRLARAKGLGETQVILRHGMRGAVNPLLTVAGLGLGEVLAGSVVVETILGWPGIGALIVSAVKGRDVPLVMGIVISTSIAVWMANTLAEILQAANDPRLREDLI